MITVSKSKLKAKMLGIFREIEKTGEELIVTDNNNPVLKVIPLCKKQSYRELFRKYQGKAKSLVTDDELWVPLGEEEWGNLV